MLREHAEQAGRQHRSREPLVTVLVPMLDEERFIGECLDSLVQQDYPIDRIEVLVIDGRSEDNSRAIVLRKSGTHKFIRLLDNPRRTTPAALNVGIGNASGDFIVRLDAHHRAAKDFVSQHVACLRREGVSCAGGPIYTVSGSFVGQAISFAMSCPFGVGDAFFRYAEKEQFVDTVANAGYPREVFHRIGLFDEELVGAEDDEFNYRLRASGGRILLSPKIRSWYYCRDSMRDLWQQYFRYGQMKVRVLQKHPREMRWRQFVPPAFVAALVGAVALSAFGIYGPLAVVAGSYAVANLSVSLLIAVRSGLKYLPLLPIAFAVLHISYGLGFLSGLFRFASRWGDQGTSQELASQGDIQ